jgi:ParB family transcriptional regulator, chromosome partitioning protein
MSMSKSPLGRGLSSLIPNKPTEKSTSSQIVNTEETLNTKDTLLEVDINLIEANPYQPRTEFLQEEIENLAQSIKDKGILQPLVVTEISENKYQLIAGERRLRAAKLAGLSTVSVVVKNGITDQDKAELALIENIQRQNLNPIERAKGFAELQHKFNITQEVIAQQLDISRSAVANTLRYLKLPEKVQNALATGDITEGHAKIIAGIDNPELQEQVLDNIINNALNVRQTAKVVKKEPDNVQNQVSSEVKQWISQLSQTIHNKVEVRKKGKRYIVTLNFFEETEIENLYKKLSQ